MTSWLICSTHVSENGGVDSATEFDVFHGVRNAVESGFVLAFISFARNFTYVLVVTRDVPNFVVRANVEHLSFDWMALSFLVEPVREVFYGSGGFLYHVVVVFGGGVYGGPFDFCDGEDLCSFYRRCLCPPPLG